VNTPIVSYRPYQFADRGGSEVQDNFWSFHLPHQILISTVFIFERHNYIEFHLARSWSWSRSI